MHAIFSEFACMQVSCKRRLQTLSQAPVQTLLLTIVGLSAFQPAGNDWSGRLNDPVSVYIDIGFENLGSGVPGSATGTARAMGLSVFPSVRLSVSTSPNQPNATIGLSDLNPIAALTVGFMVAKMGWGFAWDALHGVRTRKMGDMIVVAAHLEVDATLSLEAGHDIAVQSRERVLQRHRVLNLMTHVDPWRRPDRDHPQAAGQPKPAPLQSA